MSLKVRAARTSMTAGEDEDPTVFVVAEVFDEGTGLVIANQVLSYGLAGMDGMTDQQKQQRVADDALLWASGIKENALKAAPILLLSGVAVDIP